MKCKMEKKQASLISNLHFQTQLLESLDWNENQLEALFLYLNQALERNISFDEIKENVICEFGERPFKIIYELFIKNEY
jgi:hypothetical protein